MLKQKNLLFNNMTTSEREHQSLVDEADLTGHIDALVDDLRALAEAQTSRCSHCNEILWDGQLHICKIGGPRTFS